VRERDQSKGLDGFEQLEQSLQGHPCAAQLLIELGSVRESPKTVLEILNEVGIRPSSYEILERGDSVCMLLQLQEKDLKESLLRLTESGFSRLKGISPLR